MMSRRPHGHLAKECLSAIREVAEIPLTLLVVPAYHGQCSAQHEFEQAITTELLAGQELALHGYFHLDPQVPSDVIDWVRRRIYTAGEGEFCGLSEEEARERLTLGARWFAARGWPLSGFVAPAWLLGSGAWKALRTQNQLQYTSTLTQLIALPELRPIPAPCLTYSVRSAWRRPTSIVWNTLLSRITENAPVLRLGLHPNDAESLSVRRSWQRLLERALTDRTPATKADFMRQWRTQSVGLEKRPAALRPLSESLF